MMAKWTTFNQIGIPNALRLWLLFLMRLKRGLRVVPEDKMQTLSKPSPSLDNSQVNCSILHNTAILLLFFPFPNLQSSSSHLLRLLLLMEGWLTTELSAQIPYLPIRIVSSNTRKRASNLPTREAMFSARLPRNCSNRLGPVLSYRLQVVRCQITHLVLLPLNLTPLLCPPLTPLLAAT